mmetsp:Transcript_66865/g.173079  ORF Transcript_66865/g.173079 Transcript_66865/m.173079 type:complete len:102 (+) Transcript_66865:268-573(+)
MQPMWRGSKRCAQPWTRGVLPATLTFEQLGVNSSRSRRCMQQPWPRQPQLRLQKRQPRKRPTQKRWQRLWFSAKQKHQPRKRPKQKRWHRLRLSAKQLCSR